MAERMTEAAELPRGFEDLRGQVVKERYAIDEIVGSSPRRVAFGGHALDGGRAVVVTVLRPIVVHHQETVARFERRVAACGRVRHSGVVGPSDSGELLDGKLYLVTDRPPGAPLDRFLGGRPDGRLSWIEARPLLLSLVQGLAAAHARKVVHGALNPGCCWVDRQDFESPVVRVVDFGANTSPSTDDGDVVSSRTTVVGHDAVFMAPESAGGVLGDERADVYLVGLLAWRMLVGRAPFQGGNPFQLMAMHLGAPVPPMRGFGAEVPEAVEALVGRLLEKLPEARPGSMAEVEHALLGIDEVGRVVGVGRSVEPVVARGRKGRAQARQARGAGVLGQAGSREDAARRIEGGGVAVPQGRGRRLPGQEIVDPGWKPEPRRDVVPRPVVGREPVAAPVHVPRPAPGPMAAPMPTPNPMAVPMPTPNPMAAPMRVGVIEHSHPAPEPATDVDATRHFERPAAVATTNIEQGTEMLSRTTMAELHWKEPPPQGNVEATTMLAPQRAEPLPSAPASSETLALTAKQIRAWRAGLAAGAPPAGPTPQTSTPPVITGGTQRMTYEEVRAMRAGLPSSAAPQISPRAPARDEERTQHLSNLREDSPRAARAPAAQESTQALGPEEVAELRRSFAKLRGEPKKR